MRKDNIPALIFLVGFIAHILIGMPTLVWMGFSLMSDCPFSAYGGYNYIVRDTTNLNNGGEFMRDWIIQQNSIMVKRVKMVDDKYVVLEEYAYHNGYKWVEVTNNPLTIPLGNANLRSINR